MYRLYLAIHVYCLCVYCRIRVEKPTAIKKDQFTLKGGVVITPPRHNAIKRCQFGLMPQPYIIQYMIWQSRTQNGGCAFVSYASSASAGQNNRQCRYMRLLMALLSAPSLQFRGEVRLQSCDQNPFCFHSGILYYMRIVQRNEQCLLLKWSTDSQVCYFLGAISFIRIQFGTRVLIFLDEFIAISLHKRGRIG